MKLTKNVMVLGVLLLAMLYVFVVYSAECMQISNLNGFMLAYANKPSSQSRNRQSQFGVCTAEVNGVKWSYRVANGMAIISSGEPGKPAIVPWTEGDIVVPDKLGGKTVREIGDDAFKGCGAITSVKIPNCVSRIGANAFRECHSITVLDFPSSVRDIGAFACASMRGLDSANIRGCVALLDSTFSCCERLSTVNIGTGVRQMRRKVFEHCFNLRSIVFPKTLTLIDCGMFTYGCFDRCGKLGDVYFLGTPPEMRNFGVSLDGKIRYSTEYEVDWKRWLVAKQISGATPFDPKKDYPGGKQDELANDGANANMSNVDGAENSTGAGNGGKDDDDDDSDAGEEQETEEERQAALKEPSFTKPTPVPDTMQVNKAVKIVKELVEDDVKAMSAGKLDKQKFAMKLIEDSKLSDKVEVKFVLFRNSFNLLLNVGDIATAQKLFDVVYAKFGGRFASAMANFSRDTLKKMANTPRHAAAAKPLLALVEEAEESCKACDEAAKELGKRPSDQKARMRLAINAIKISDWELALRTYAKNDDDRGKICSWELMEPNARTADYTSEKVGDYWWGFVDGKDERRLLFKSATNHAAYWYRKALAEGKMSELKKKLVEKRLSSISRAGKLKAKVADKSGGGKLKCYKCKGEGKVKVFRLESCAECDGKGVVKTGYKSGSDCAACGRRGRVSVERDAECPVCHGKGKL